MLSDVGTEGHPVYRLVTGCDCRAEYGGTSTNKVFLDKETKEVYCSDCIDRIREEQRLKEIPEEVGGINLSKFKPLTVRKAIEFLKSRE